MNKLLLDHFNEENKSYSCSDQEDEDWNIDDELLCEGASAKNIQYSDLCATKLPNNSLKMQRWERNKFNTCYDKTQLLENVDFKPNQYMSNDALSLSKPKSLKQEISMLLKMLAKKNSKAMLAQTDSSSNKNIKFENIDNLQIEFITMRDVESGF